MCLFSDAHHVFIAYIGQQDANLLQFQRPARLESRQYEEAGEQRKNCNPNPKQTWMIFLQMVSKIVVYNGILIIIAQPLSGCERIEMVAPISSHRSDMPSRPNESSLLA